MLEEQYFHSRICLLTKTPKGYNVLWTQWRVLLGVMMLKRCPISAGPRRGLSSCIWLVHSPWKRLFNGGWSEQQLDGWEGGSAESWLSFPLLTFLWRTLVMLRLIHTHTHDEENSNRTTSFSHPTPRSNCSFGVITVTKVVKMRLCCNHCTCGSMWSLMCLSETDDNRRNSLTARRNILHDVRQTTTIQKSSSTFVSISHIYNFFLSCFLLSPSSRTIPLFYPGCTGSNRDATPEDVQVTLQNKGF